MRHHDRRSAPGCQEKRPDRIVRDRWNAGNTAQPAYGFPGTPPSAIVYTVPEFIWEMSDTINPGHAQMNSIFNPPLVIPSAATVDTVKRLYGGRSTEG